MPLFTPIAYDDAGCDLKAVYDEILQFTRLDAPPNWAKYLGANPALLQVTWSYLKQTLYGGAVSRICKELLVFGIAIAQRSEYCVEAHAYSILKLSNALSFDELVGLVKGQNHGVVTPRDRIAIDVLLASTDRKCRVTDEETRILKQAGFSDADVVELLSTISLGLMFTSMTRGADIPIDDRFRVPGYYRPWERLDG